MSDGEITTLEWIAIELRSLADEIDARAALTHSRGGALYAPWAAHLLRGRAEELDPQGGAR